MTDLNPESSGKYRFLNQLKEISHSRCLSIQEMSLLKQIATSRASVGTQSESRRKTLANQGLQEKFLIKVDPRRELTVLLIKRLIINKG